MTETVLRTRASELPSLKSEAISQPPAVRTKMRLEDEPGSGENPVRSPAEEPKAGLWDPNLTSHGLVGPYETLMAYPCQTLIGNVAARPLPDIESELVLGPLYPALPPIEVLTEIEMDPPAGTVKLLADSEDVNRDGAPPSLRQAARDAESARGASSSEFVRVTERAAENASFSGAPTPKSSFEAERERGLLMSSTSEIEAAPSGVENSSGMIVRVATIN
jgi:hypothetical protein